MVYDFDLFVIGGGSGGVRASRLAAQDGHRVGLAEEFRMGGTCVIRGCVPKKLLVYASAFSDAFADARGFGWDAGSASFDWSKLIKAKDKEINRLEGLYRSTLKNAGVTSFDARGTVRDAHHVTLSNGETFSARHILVAVGGAPFVPDIPGAGLAITSNEIFDLTNQPKRVLIIGGGYIACEFAGIMNGLGSEVTQFYRGAQILRGFDDEVRGHVADAMIARGVNLHLGTDVTAIERSGKGLLVKCTSGADKPVDAVLYATGRKPNTAGIGLDAAGVKMGRWGEIIVDEYSQTAVKSIYAVGDVTNRVNLTPVAIHEGVAFVETVFRDNPTKPDHMLVPTAVFTQPEIGTLGQTEEAARDLEPIEIYRSVFRPMMNVLGGRQERMLMKLIVSQATRKVLGVHIVGPASGEMIQLAGIAVKMGATKEDFDATMAVHPTVAEELVTMKDPARSN